MKRLPRWIRLVNKLAADEKSRPCIKITVNAVRLYGIIAACW